jgi:hypothetical protein
MCDADHIVQVPQEGYVQWQAGELIQKALPSLNDDDRELLISGTCPGCWEEDDWDDWDYEIEDDE